MKRFFLILLISFPLLLNAQSSFLTYHLSGNVSVKKNNKSQSLQIGQIVDTSSSVIVEKNSSVEFIYNKGSIILIDKPGIYKLQKFIGTINMPSNSFLSNYLTYIWDEFTHEGGTPEEHRQSYMDNMGAAERGDCPFKFYTYLDTVYYYSGNLSLKWENKNKASAQEIDLYSIQNKNVPLLTIKTEDNSFSIDSLARGIKPGNYFWTVSSNRKTSCRLQYIKIVSATAFTQFCDSIKNSIGRQFNNAEENYIVGHFLELNHYYAEAYIYYENAFEAEPGNYLYKSTVAQYKKLLF